MAVPPGFHHPTTTPYSQPQQPKPSSSDSQPLSSLSSDRKRISTPPGPPATATAPGPRLLQRLLLPPPPSIILPVTTETLCQNAVIVLVDRIRRKVILIAHSQGTAGAVLLADKQPSLVKALILVEAVGPPFVEPLLNGGIPTRA